MKPLFLPWLVFTCGAFVGPSLVPIMLSFPTFSSANNLIADVVLFLWPMQPIAVMEASIGTFWAVFIAVSANVLVFAILGIIVVLSTHRKTAFLAGSGTLFFLIIWFGYWLAGSDVTHIKIRPVATAVGLYGALLYLTYCLATKPRNDTRSAVCNE